MNRYELFKSIKSFLHDCDSDDNKNWTYDEQASSICAMVDAHVAAEIERVTEVTPEMLAKSIRSSGQHIFEMSNVQTCDNITAALRERAKNGN